MSPLVADASERFAALFRAERDRLPGGGLAWLNASREAALDSFQAQGLPSNRVEGWRHTPSRALTDTEFIAAEKPKVRARFAGRALCPVDFHRVVIQNGRFQGDDSRVTGLPEGVSVLSLADVLRDDPESLRTELSRPIPSDGLAFAALAAASFRDGIVVCVARHARLDRPIHMILSSADGDSGRPQAAHVRVLLILEDGASAEILVESLSDGSAPFWTNLLTSVVLGEGASLKHYWLQHENLTGAMTAATLVTVGRSARYESHAFNFGGTLIRNDLRVRLAGAGADCALNGLSLLRGDEVVDHHTVVEHACVGGTTRQLYKAVLDERSRFIFDGLVDVHPGAQKTDASVYNKNLLLSEDADVHTNPEFKILADDVSCKHGGAIGQLSPESLFYLRSRGIGSEDARRLLVYAFGAEMLERVGLEQLRHTLADALHARMPEENLR